MLALLGVSTLAITYPVTASADGWLCIADQATGFSFHEDTRSWEISKFNVEGRRYIIRHLTDDERAGYEQSMDKNGEIHPPLKWGFLKVGEQFPEPCFIDKLDEYNNLICGFTPTVQQLWFNQKTLRFQHVYLAGYVSPGKVEGGDTPSIDIGKCSPM